MVRRYCRINWVVVEVRVGKESLIASSIVSSVLQTYGLVKSQRYRNRLHAFTAYCRLRMDSALLAITLNKENTSSMCRISKLETVLPRWTSTTSNTKTIRCVMRFAPTLNNVHYRLFENNVIEASEFDFPEVLSLLSAEEQEANRPDPDNTNCFFFDKQSDEHLHMTPKAQESLQRFLRETRSVETSDDDWDLKDCANVPFLVEVVLFF